jgi:hypothetical protein
MLNISFQAQFMIYDDDDPNLSSVHLVRETNLALQCAMFPCIKIGYSPLIMLYGEDVTTHNMDSEFKKMEEYEKVNEKISEPWHSLGSTLAKTLPPSFKEENQEEKIVKEAVMKNIAPWEGVLDRSVKFIPDMTSWHTNKLENSGFPTVRFFSFFMFLPFKK